MTGPRAALLVALALLPAATHDPLAGRVAGRPVECIDDSDAGMTILDDESILHRRGRHLWISHPAPGCHALRPFATLVVERFGGPLCRGDPFHTVDPPSTIPSMTCRFGPFVPYDKPSPARVTGRSG